MDPYFTFASHIFPLLLGGGGATYPVQTPAEKVFGPIKISQKQLLRRHLHVYGGASNYTQKPNVDTKNCHFKGSYRYLFQSPSFWVQYPAISFWGGIFLGIFFFFFFALFFFWSSGPPVPWSPGPPVLWSSGPLVPWSPGPPVLWSSGPLVLWSSSSTSVLDNHNNNNNNNNNNKNLACNNRGQR